MIQRYKAIQKTYNTSGTYTFTDEKLLEYLRATTLVLHFDIPSGSSVTMRALFGGTWKDYGSPVTSSGFHYIDGIGVFEDFAFDVDTSGGPVTITVGAYEQSVIM